MLKNETEKLEFSQELLVQMTTLIGLLYCEVKDNVKLQTGLSPIVKTRLTIVDYHI